MIKLILFAIILQITNIFAVLCPDNTDSKFFCTTIVCTDQETNGEIAFGLCIQCFPKYLREQCPEEIAKHFEEHIISEETRLFHLKKNKPNSSTVEYVVTEKNILYEDSRLQPHIS